MLITDRFKYSDGLDRLELLCNFSLHISRESDVCYEPVPPSNASPKELIIFYAEQYGVEASEVAAQIEDLCALELPNNQKRKDMYHLMAVWAGVRGKGNRQPLPDYAVQAVRDIWPNESGKEYMGFKTQ
eukprot:1179969-Prorocentrum_minimum.AAC.5